MNEQEAIRLYRAAMLQGYTQALFNLGYCYQYVGNGFKRNNLMAACLYTIAGDHGHLESIRMFNEINRHQNAWDVLGLKKVMLADV